MSTVFNRIYALTKGKMAFPDQETRLEIGKIVFQDFRPKRKKFGHYTKIDANPNDGDFKVIYYPPSYTRSMDAIISKFLNLPVPKRKRIPIKKTSAIQKEVTGG